MPNPIQALSIKSDFEYCQYRGLGCTHRSSVDEMKKHLSVCTYRPYKCIGTSLNIWCCDWIGSQQKFEDHMLKEHSQIGEFFNDTTENACVPFVDNMSISTMNLINGFNNNKKFVFFYKSNNETKMLYFLIYFIGNKKEAKQFYYTFDIKIPNNNYKSISYTEQCLNDSDNVLLWIEMKNCIAIPHSVAKNYLYENSIHFDFVIKRKIDVKDPTEDPPKTPVNILPPVKAKKPENPFTFPSKGILKPNRELNGKSIPASARVLQPSISMTSTILAASTAAGIINEGKKALDPTKSYSPPLQSPISVSDCSEYSSINKMKLPAGYGSSDAVEPPCLTPSITKHYTHDELNKLCSKQMLQRSTSLIDTNDSRTIRRYENSTVPYYKATDSRIYRKIIPGDCLSRPKFYK